MSHIEVEFPRNGDVLSHHDGRETPEGLEVVVRGTCTEGDTIEVAGRHATVTGGRFEGVTVLKDLRNEITITSIDTTQTLTVLYDRNSVPRYRFSVDDVIWCFTEVARHADRYPSLFDHWFFAFFRKLHNDFGAHVQMNIYFEDPEAGFDLTQFPDTYRQEWQDNAHWLRLSFHALSDRCYGSRIYRDTTEQQLTADYRKVAEQIVRFAGEPALLETYTTLHWAVTNRAGGRALAGLGIRGLTGQFGADSEGTPCGCRYHLDAETSLRYHRRNMCCDPETDLYFVNCPRFLNNCPVGLIAWYYDRLVDGTGGRDPFDAIDFLVHEEHFWRGFLGGRAYKPDSMERCMTAACWATERGLKPVNFEEGLAGGISPPL